jgi:integrase/recombinase XerD
VFQPMNRAGRVSGDVLSEKVVWQLIKPYAEAAGVPGIAPHDLSRTCAKLRRAGGGELEQIQLAPGARLGADHGAMPRHQVGPGSRAE